MELHVTLGSNKPSSIMNMPMRNKCMKFRKRYRIKCTYASETVKPPSPRYHETLALN